MLFTGVLRKVTEVRNQNLLPINDSSLTSAPRMPEEAQQPKPAPSKKKVFLKRLVSSVILWAVVITSLFSGNKILSDYVFLAIMMILAWAGLVRSEEHTSELQSRLHL